ncbi:unnamed protein product, partial [Tetraodon nigroviridis]
MNWAAPSKKRQGGAGCSACGCASLPSVRRQLPPLSHDTGWWFWLPWRCFLLPASGLVGNLSQGYSPPSFAFFPPPRLGITPPSDKVTVNTLPHPSPADAVAPHTASGKGSLWCVDPEYRPNLIQALKKQHFPAAHAFSTPPASP